MSLTDQQVVMLEQRLNLIEAAINDINTALNNVATLKQLKQLNIIKQNDLINLKERVTALESEVTTIQGTIAP